MNVPADVGNVPSAELAARAASLVQANQAEQAAELYDCLLQRDPQHRDALNFFATQALAAGKIAQSIGLYQRALALHAEDAGLYKNLGLALRNAGRPQEALTAFETALRLQPQYPMVHLHRAALLEERGQAEQALSGYLAALGQAENLGLVAQREQLPAGLRQGLEHALRVVRAARADYLAQVLQPLRAQHGDEALARVDRSLRVYLGLEAALPGEPKQRCTFMTFQGIPAQGWFERRQFAWFSELEDRTEEIRAELLAVLGSEEGFRPFIQVPREHPGAKYWEALNDSPNWNAFFFYRDGRRFADNCRRCPVTAGLLDQLPLSRVAEHSPESLFSVLKPGAHIPPHTGVINTRLVAHLPLIIPPDCGLRVNGETRVWQDHECLVFDDTFEHEAWNHSPRTRVVLIFDIWNPYLTAVECEAMRVVVEGIGRFNALHGQIQAAYRNT
ncbi:MAG: aspartyl/asparaginyl beta-hydroxylase domain-containing protein [Gammaproteobacteria bacterium]